MRLLFIPLHAGPDQYRITPWRGLEAYAEVDVFPLPSVADALGRFTGPADLEACLDRVRELKSRHYDFIVGHANSFLWMSVFRLAGRDTPFAIVPNFNHVLAYDVYALALAAQFRRPADLLFTGSRSSQRAFERFGFSCFPYHAPGIPLVDYQRKIGASALPRSTWGIPDGVPLLLYTGRLQPDKSVYSLILAHRELLKTTRAHLVICYHLEHRDYAERCRQLAAEVGNITFLKDPPQEELAHLYSASDVFVLIGVSEHETFGRSPIEAMSCGAVPVVPAYDGFAENIPANAGVLVPTYGDFADRKCGVIDFANAVAAVLGKSPQDFTAMRELGMAAVRKFDSASCTEIFIKAVRSALESGVGRPASPPQTWSQGRLPPEAAAMTAALEGKDLKGVLAQFLAEKRPQMDVSEGKLVAHRRLWFSSFFPPAVSNL